MGRSLLLLPVLALAAAGLTGCGEDEASASELIRSAPAALEEAGTMRMAMAMEVAGQEIEADGAFDLAEQTGMMTMQLPPPVNGEIETVFDGTTYFMSTAAFGPAAPIDAEWIRFDLEALAETSGIDLQQLSQAGQNNPTDALSGLEAVSEDGIEELGSEEIDGVSTTGYAATLDMGAAFDQAQEALEESGADDGLIDREQFDRFVAAYGDDPIAVEVWIGDDGLVRRQVMDTVIQGQEMAMTLDLFDYGEPVEIAIPDAADTVDFTDILQEF